MELKYMELINGFENCPPINCQSRNTVGYRFVFEDLGNTNNYIPPLAIDPTRINTPKFCADPNRCSGYALSMFSDAQSARKSYEKMAKNNKNIHKTLGTHIAEFTILETDGIISPPSCSGHFDLHEFAEADFTNRVRLICNAH